jgi:hypothetical protein
LDKVLKRLDELIADLGGTDTGTRSRGPCDLLLEHLQAARRDLLGSMLGEYRASLQYALESAVCITDKRVRTDTKRILQSLLNPEVSMPRRPRRPPARCRPARLHLVPLRVDRLPAAGPAGRPDTFGIEGQTLAVGELNPIVSQQEVFGFVKRTIRSEAEEGCR